MRAFSLTVLLVGFLQLSGQESYFQSKHIGVDDGLSHRQVTDVIQDRNGIIWIATKNGLNKYDGYRFQHFSDFSNKGLPQLSHSIINDLALDARGNLWIATNAGVDILNPNTYELRSYSTAEIFPEKEGFKKVERINILKNGRVFIKSFNYGCSDYYFSCVEYINNDFKKLIVEDSSRNGSYIYINTIFEDVNGNTWIRPTNSLEFFQIDKTHSVEKKRKLPKNFEGVELKRFIASVQNEVNGPLYGCNHLKDQQISISISEDRTNIGLALKDTSFHRLYDYNLETEEFQQRVATIDDQSYSPTKIFYDANGAFWFQKDSRIYKTDQEITQQIDIKEFGRNNLIACFYESIDGTIWLGTSFGLITIRESKYPFKSYHNTLLNSNGYGNSMRAIVVDSNTIYCSVIEDGIYKGDLDSGVFREIIDKRFPSQSKTHEVNAYGLYNDGKHLWISNRFDPGILRFDLAKSELYHLVDSNNTVGFGSCLLKTETTLWQGTDKGINQIDIEKGEIKLFNPANGINTKEFNIASFIELANGEVLVGTVHSGIFKIDLENNFMKWMDKSDGLSGNNIQSIAETNEHLWIGASNGLNQYNKKTKQFRQYSLNEGLLNNNITGIFIQDSTLWCSTELGISRLNINRSSFRNYTTDNGLPHNEYNRFSSYQIDSTQFLFGGLNGMVLVNKNDLSASPFSPQPILIELTKYDGKMDSLVRYAFNNNEDLIIGPYDNSFTFYFTTNDYFNTEQITYSYYLEGFDSRWTPIGKDNRLRFNRLPAGEYRFKLRTTDANGIWSSIYLDIPFEVEEVFYKTLWFVILCAIGIIGILSMLFKYRLNQLKKIELFRLKVASDLHDDVGSLLTQISMQSQLIEQDVYEKEEDRKNLIKKIAISSRQAVKSMRDVVWSIDSRKETVEDLADRMGDYLSEVLASSTIEYYWERQGAKEKQKLSVILKQSTYLIFKEAINNVLKHSDATEIRVSLDVKKKQLKLKIQDNGSISKNSGKRPGQGLENMKMRARNCKGDIEINTEKGYKITFKASI